MDLLLIRHALPVRIDGGDGPADPELSDDGWQQAGALAAWLVDDGIEVMVASPLRRAQETAEPLATVLDLPDTDDPARLKELQGRFFTAVGPARANLDVLAARASPAERRLAGDRLFSGGEAVGEAEVAGLVDADHGAAAGA